MRTIRFTMLVVGLTFVIPFAAHVAIAQQTSQSSSEDTPTGCLRAARQFERDAYQAAQAANQPFDQQATHVKAIERVKQCGAKFNPETIDASQRPNLGLLYFATGDSTRAKVVLARAEHELPADPNVRATALLQLMRAYRANPNSTAAIADCQRVVTRLDSVPGVHPQKLAAHGSLISWANGDDFDDISRANVAAVLALIPSLTPDEQKDEKNAPILINVYQTRAMHQANALHPDSALQTLAEAPKVLSAIPNVAEAFASDVQRYSMVGKPAPAIHADYWVNNPAGPLKGTATVLVFTANWCHSCHASYPAISAAMKAYPATRLQTVFSVNLDGQFRGVAMQPAQEVEADKKYFTEEHNFTNPVALQRTPNGEMPPPDSTANAQAYAMSYLPQVVIIDQQGIVRAFLQGWDETGNRERSFRTALKTVLGS